jgi:hypothetical protein
VSEGLEELGSKVPWCHSSNPDGRRQILSRGAGDIGVHRSSECWTDGVKAMSLHRGRSPIQTVVHMYAFTATQDMPHQRLAILMFARMAQGVWSLGRPSCGEGRRGVLDRRRRDGRL